ncbi:MAG TPA: hypothetical protein VH540_07150 [Ktedonobacterales bacterium]|jgi:hypothetical protein
MAKTNQNKPKRQRDEEDNLPTDAGYDTLLLLERMESLLEEMEELGVSTRQEIEARIAALHKQLDAEER